ncbi:ATP-dependent zinc metalloprotease FtsH [Candidatus Chromulinivorax destructor]|uniref:ATP-dependent zinc metalloprotease FtsH n=1 Tax=Candidatus Chromulinivorax destructor TaxID=2066483 RepID=A0A345ZCP3_9BACT|nr:ATP-dependent zinc metalloprotease FtsH [Candidatus Chromulinivorax destructor]AXK61060.1 cell division protein FtsH [Candidatus Chromulinivorax destructor]
MSKKPFKKPSFFGGPKALFIAIIVLVGLLSVLTQLTDYARNMSDLTYKQYIEKVRADEVKSVTISGQHIDGVFKNDQFFQVTLSSADQSKSFVISGTMLGHESKNTDDPNFQATIVQRDGDFDLLDKHGVTYKIIPPAAPTNVWYVILLVLLLVSLGLLSAWYLNKQGKGNNNQGGGGLFNMGKSRAKIFMPNTIKEKFTSVAGAHEAKEELFDIVDFLKNPGKYRKIGAKIPRGVLLQGEPGTGKTLLARAVAGEAQCPFISVSGSDFVEVFVGVGASRVRDLFAQAKRNAPCIVFIDEIDAVGRQRNGSGNGGSDEREQTLNQLLTEMDGFEVNEEPIIVMAATNRADVLDKALLRPGRFDRIVNVPVPDLLSREEILHVHLKKVKIASDIDVKKLARATTGYTGADLANYINTAAILATKAGLTQITMVQFDEALYSKLLGKLAKTIVMTDEEKRITAYHEGGHALINILMGDLTSPLHKVTITPRSGGSLGVTCSLPNREKYLKTVEENLADICICMGGRAAEMLACNVMTTGASSDFAQATRVAYYSVAHVGMTQALGMVVYDRSHIADATQAKIDVEVAKILEQEYQRAYALLVEHRDKLEILAALLLEKEMVEASEIYEALGMIQPDIVKLV